MENEMNEQEFVQALSGAKAAWTTVRAAVRRHLARCQAARPGSRESLRAHEALARARQARRECYAEYKRLRAAL